MVATTERVVIVKMDEASQRLRKMGEQSQSPKITGLSLAEDGEMGLWPGGGLSPMFLGA